MSLYKLPSLPADAMGESLRRSLVVGAAIGGVFFLGLGGWAALAPLSSAAVAPGVISPEGNRRTIQHLEGGIVRELLVREGTAVEADQPVVVLESSMAQANHDVLIREFRSALANQWRLMAERYKVADFEIPTSDAEAGDDEEMRILFEAQRAVFLSRREAREKRKEVLQQRIGQLDEEMRGLKAQIASQSTQLALIREEAVGVAEMLEKGYERRPRLLALKKSEAEVVGTRAGHQAAVAKAVSAVAEAQAQIDSIESQHMEEVETQLTEVSAKLGSLREKLKAAKDVVTRTVITSPVAGTVVELRARTIGGVVTAGQPILDIVPRDEQLLIDARVSPNDIEEVRPDMPAKVVMTGYKQRNMLRLEGRVREVSADRIVDPRTSQVYYLARIELPAGALREVPEISLKAGMPAEVMIITGERTLLNYLLDPLSSSFRKSFRES
jgi:HlyD family secretion protein